jgi:hypothetical protein
MKKGLVMIYTFPPELHRAIRLLAAERDTSINAMILLLLEIAVRDIEEKKVRA